MNGNIEYTIYLCPRCGQPIHETLILTYPPILTYKCTNCNWYFEGNRPPILAQKK